LQAVQDAMADLQTQLDKQEKDIIAQKSAQENLQKSEAGLRVAVDDLKKQEDAYNNQLSSLEQKSKDTSGSVIQKNKAAAELAQLKQENPLPLRKAKLTQEAALRKVERERKAVEAAIIELGEQKKRVEKALKDTETKLKEAQDYLDYVKRQGGSAQGAIWWLERELQEAKKYMPQSKQK